jgi:hypothetical protein
MKTKYTLRNISKQINTKKRQKPSTLLQHKAKAIKSQIHHKYVQALIKIHQPITEIISPENRVYDAICKT